MRGQDGQVALSQHICDEHRYRLAHALRKEWQAQQAASPTPAVPGRRWGWQMGVRPS